MDEKLLFALLVVIIVLIIICIIILVKKSKKNYDEEISEILDDLKKSKPREDLINEKIELPIGENKKPTVVKEEKLDLDEVLDKMQKTIDNQEKIVENFEEEQEEKSIISYKELVDAMKKENYSEEIEKHELEEEETAKEKVKEFLKTDPEEKKFKNTDFISPIFGKMEANVEYPTVKVKEEIKEDFKHAKTDNKNVEFLESLKEFRNNL